MLTFDDPAQKRVVSAQLRTEVRQNIFLSLILIIINIYFVIVNPRGSARTLIMGSIAGSLQFYALLMAVEVLILWSKITEIVIVAGLFVLIEILHRAGFVGSSYAEVAIIAGCLVAVLSGTPGCCRLGVVRCCFVLIAALSLPLASSISIVGQRLTITSFRTFDVIAYLIDNSYGRLIPLRPVTQNVVADGGGLC